MLCEDFIIMLCWGSLCSVLVISESGFMQNFGKKELPGRLKGLDCAVGMFAYF